jgi:hypothetical protein
MVFVASENSGDIPPKHERNAGEPAEDLPPELFRYRDEGCEFAASCLRCPYPECLQEMPGGRRRLLKQVRNSHIRRLSARGWQPTELALLFGVSMRTVQRALKQPSGEDERVFEMLKTMVKGDNDA